VFADGEPVALPPWMIEARVDDPHTAPARDDSFASLLGATAWVGGDATGRSVATLGETLRRAPGVIVQESFGGFEPPRLIIRGSGLDSAPTSRGVAFLVDGLSFARADGSFHSGLLDPQLFSRIEVYRGSVHAALTPAALGGVFNAVTIPTGKPAGRLGLQIGDFGAWRFLVTDERQFSGTTARLSATHVRQDGFRPRSVQERTAALVRLQHLFTTDRTLETTLYYTRPRYEVPGPLTLTDALARPRTVSAAVERDRPSRDTSLVRLASQFKSRSPGGSATAGVAWQHWRDDFRQLQPNGETFGEGDDLNGQATLARELTLGATAHHLLARVVFSTGTTDQQRYLNIGSGRGPRFSRLGLRAETLAFSLEDIVWLRPDLAFGGGVTLLGAERRVSDRMEGINGSGGISRTDRFGDVSPRMGVTWEIRPNLAFFANLSRGTEPPAFDDIISVQGTHPALVVRTRRLEAQHATTTELGARGRLGALSWNVTAYHARWSGEILRLADAAGLPRGAVNAGHTRHEGVELALRWHLLESPGRLTLNGTATWSRFRFAADPIYGANRLAGAPPHLGQLELLYDSPSGWFAGVESIWIAGRTPVDHANLLSYGGHVRWDTRVGWKGRNGFTLFLAARNLLDRRYIASTAGVLDRARNPASLTIFLPGSVRTLTAGLDYPW
jgi:iron complex outermembrane receptor protein